MSQESKSVLITESKINLKEAYFKYKFRRQFPSCARILWAARLIADYGVITVIQLVRAIHARVSVKVAC